MNVRVRNSLKLIGVLLVCLLMACAVSGCSGTDEPVAEVESPVATEAPVQTVNLVLASTTSTQDSGLFDVLIPAFEADNPGIKVQVIAVGTGEAIQKGRDGDADALLVHSKSDEEEFVADGLADDRFDVMYNDYLIVGAAEDPAAIADATSAADALSRIAASEAVFVSRGDDSGTHKKELKLWKETGIEPAGDWYKEIGQGMGETLKVADEMGAYTISDRATYLSLSRDGAIESKILFEGASDLLNQYGVLVVNSARQLDAAKAFKDWILSPAGQSIIETYGVEKYGEPLFFPNAH
jgi:tungstate transport system substrate-binding protein